MALVEPEWDGFANCLSYKVPLFLVSGELYLFEVSFFLTSSSCVGHIVKGSNPVLAVVVAFLQSENQAEFLVSKGSSTTDSVLPNFTGLPDIHSKVLVYLSILVRCCVDLGIGEH